MGSPRRYSPQRQCPRSFLALWAEVERRETVAAGKRQHLRDQREVARFRPAAEQRLQLVELCCGRVAHLITHHAADTDPPSPSQRLQARRDIHTITEDVVFLNDYIADDEAGET